MFRILLNSYVVLVLVSCFLWFNLWLQVGLACAWLILAIAVGRRASLRGVATVRLLLIGWTSQLPGLLLGSYGLVSLGMHTPNELAAGMQEVWVHPFLPALELFLPNRLGQWSAPYLFACGLPVLIGAMPTLGGLFRRTKT